MTIKQLHYFIAVAETRSFTHAARNYFIAQTAMSQQISALEKELGYRLFHRTNRSVELTEAGQVLFNQLRPLVLKLEDAVQAASAVAGVENQVFRIGLNDQAVNRFLSGPLSAFSQQEPHVTPMLVSDNHLMLLEALAEGAIDIMLLGQRFYAPRAMLTAAEVFSYPLLEYVLAVPATSPLAARRSISWAELQGLRLIAYSPLRENQQGAQLTDLLHAHGVSARIFCSTRSVDTAMIYVEAEMGCCLLPVYASSHADSGVRLLPLESECRDTMLLIHHKNAENPLIGEFLSVCRRTLKSL